MQIILIIAFLLWKAALAMQPLKYYDFPGIDFYYLVTKIESYYVIAAQDNLYYERTNKSFTMQKYKIPSEIGKLHSSVAIPEINSMLIAGASNQIMMLNFNSSAGGINAKRTFKLKHNKNLHFVRIEAIERIPDKNYVMASADNSSIAKIDWATGNITYIPQHIDYVHSMAISRDNLYLTTSTTGLICLSDYTSGSSKYFFTTKGYLKTTIATRINITVFVDFMPEKQYFGLSSSRSHFIFMFDATYQRIFNRLESNQKVRCLASVPGTSYIAVGSMHHGNTLSFISVDSSMEFYTDEVNAMIVAFEDNHKMLILDSQRKLVVWTIDARLCHFSCLGCKAPMDNLHCLNCVPGYIKNKEGRCIKKCPLDQKFIITNQTCSSAKNCPDHFYEKIPALCFPCSASCGGCKGSSDTECTSCRHSVLRALGKCTHEKCKKFSSNYDLANNRCLKCFDNCENCEDNGPFNCTSCKPGHIMDYLDKTCRQPCYLREYYNYTLGLCMRCPPKCIQCNESSTCELCEIGRKVIGGKCLDSCPSQTFEEPFNGTCSPCIDSNCLQCPYDGKCSMCKEDFILDLQFGVCSQNCTRQGVYLTESKICAQCPKGCRVCEEGKKCEVCYRGFKIGADKVCYERGDSSHIFMFCASAILIGLVALILLYGYCMSLKRKRNEKQKLQRETRVLREKEKRSLAKAMMKMVISQKVDTKLRRRVSRGNTVMNPFAALTRFATRKNKKKKSSGEVEGDGGAEDEEGSHGESGSGKSAMSISSGGAGSRSSGSKKSGKMSKKGSKGSGGSKKSRKRKKKKKRKKRRRLSNSSDHVESSSRAMNRKLNRSDGDCSSGHEKENRHKRRRSGSRSSSGSKKSTRLKNKRNTRSRVFFDTGVIETSPNNNAVDKGVPVPTRLTDTLKRQKDPTGGQSTRKKTAAFIQRLTHGGEGEGRVGEREEPLKPSKQKKEFSSTDIPKERVKSMNHAKNQVLNESKIIKRVKTGKKSINQFFDSQIEENNESDGEEHKEGGSGVDGPGREEVKIKRIATNKQSVKLSFGDDDMRSLRIKKHMLEEYSKFTKTKQFQ